MFAVLATAVAPFLGKAIDFSSATEHFIFFRLRLPRALLAFGCGAGLAAAGVVLQAILKNPLATPFTLGVLYGTWGWILFGLVWGLSLAGIIFKAVGGTRYPILSTCLYLAMGWLVLIAVKPLWLVMPTWGLFWLLAGGICYTLGVVFWLMHRLPFHHTVWHLFVLGGSICHFLGMLLYLVPVPADV